jgi:hypothetical protein
MSHSSSRPVHHILPTSNIVERLFSIAKFIKCDNTKHMLPANLDRLFFLRDNFKRWGQETVQACLDLPPPSVAIVEDDADGAAENLEDEPLIDEESDEEPEENGRRKWTPSDVLV